MNSVMLARRGVATRPNEKLAMREIGHTGTPMTAGVIGEEYLAALKTPALRSTVWKKMRADAQVSALLAVTMLPLEAANYTVVPNEKDPNQTRAALIAERITDNLRAMDTPWRSFLYQAYLSLAYGFALFEMVYEDDTDGSRLMRIKDYAPRSQSTIIGWDVDAHGKLVQVRQEVFTDRQPVRAEIPGDRCLLFTHRQEGSNFEGRPVLRDAYQHYWFKALLYRVQGIGAERHGVGFPTLKIPRDLYAEELAVAEDLIRGIRVNTEGGAVIPNDYEFKIETGRGFMFDKAIEHHNRMIALTGLAQFLTLGSGTESGSYALSKVHGQFFLMSLKALMERFTDTMSNTAFRNYVDINWGPDVPSPVMNGEMMMLDPVQIAETLESLVKGGLMTVTGDIRDTIRDSLGFPPEAVSAMTHPDSETKPPTTSISDGDDDDDVSAAVATAAAIPQDLQLTLVGMGM